MSAAFQLKRTCFADTAVRFSLFVRLRTSQITKNKIIAVFISITPFSTLAWLTTVDVMYKIRFPKFWKLSVSINRTLCSWKDNLLLIASFLPFADHIQIQIRTFPLSDRNSVVLHVVYDQNKAAILKY